MQFFTVRFIGSISAAGGAAGLFQFPLLREGRRGKSCTTSSFLRFQFTLLREGRLPTVCHASPPKAFQFTPLREGRLDDVMNALKPILFQFTPLREGRLDYDELNIECEVFQFTPLREGRRLGWGLRPFALGISIHAPPRGATRACVQTQRRLQTISIHAPPRGATTAGIFDATRRPYFNSRPSARGDLTRARIIYSNSQNSGQ